MNEGKRWENTIKKCLGIECIRLYDTTNGYVGINNPCDFIYYAYPIQILIEAKTVKSDRMPFSNISDNQLGQLIEHGHIMGELPIIFIYFRKSARAFIIPISKINELISLGFKSISVGMCDNNDIALEIPLNKKIVNVEFDKKDFNIKVQKLWRDLKCE